MNTLNVKHLVKPSFINLHESILFYENVALHLQNYFRSPPYEQYVHNAQKDTADEDEKANKQWKLVRRAKQIEM